MKKSILIAVMLFAAACATTKLVAPTQPDAERATQKFPGITLADLQEGRTMYEANCQKCHKLKDPKSRTEEQWREIVPVMAKKAKIDAHTREQILKYVVIYSKQF